MDANRALSLASHTHAPAHDSLCSGIRPSFHPHRPRPHARRVGPEHLWSHCLRRNLSGDVASSRVACLLTGRPQPTLSLSLAMARVRVPRPRYTCAALRSRVSASRPSNSRRQTLPYRTHAGNLRWAFSFSVCPSFWTLLPHAPATAAQLPHPLHARNYPSRRLHGRTSPKSLTWPGKSAISLGSFRAVRRRHRDYAFLSARPLSFLCQYRMARCVPAQSLAADVSLDSRQHASERRLRRQSRTGIFEWR